MEACVSCGIKDEWMPLVYSTVTHRFETVCAHCQQCASPGTYLANVPHAA